MVNLNIFKYTVISYLFYIIHAQHKSRPYRTYPKLKHRPKAQIVNLGPPINHRIPIKLVDALPPQLLNTAPDNSHLAQYNFEYLVHDPHTGDFKEHRETRNNNVVQGYYSFLEPDGRRRVVHYNANDIDGFNAVVTHEIGEKVPIQVVQKNVPIMSPNMIEGIKIFQSRQARLAGGNHVNAVSHVVFEAPEYSYKYSNSG